MAEKTEAQKKGIRNTIIGVLVFVIVVQGLFFNKILQPRVLSTEELRANGAIVFEQPRIVRDFELVDHTGEPYTKEDWKGQWTLVYFGFTHCPDICPTTLMKLGQLMPKLDEDIREQTQVALVTTDPARDTPEKLDQYVSHFNPEFTGVTGDFITIKKLAGDLNVGFNKVMLDDGDYTIDHTGHLVLVNPYGDYHAFFKPPFELAKLKLTYQSIVTSFDY